MPQNQSQSQFQSQIQLQIHLRKTAPEPFQPISGAALKKAKKLFEASQKKSQKAAERHLKDDSDRVRAAEEDAKRLEDSKKIVLVQDLSLPKAKKVCCNFGSSLLALLSEGGQRVTSMVTLFCQNNDIAQ